VSPGEARTGKELADRVAAGFRVLCLATHEEARARALVQRTFPDARVVAWTSTRGLDAADRATGDPLAALALAVEARAPTVFVLLDLAPFLHEPRVVRALRDFIALPASTPTAIVLIAPAIDLPPELERDVAVLSLPLPDARDLGAIYQGLGGARTAAWNAAPILRAAHGLTANEAARALRMALALPDAAAAARLVVAEKCRAVRQSSTLEIIDVDVALDDVGGLDVLKAWLRLRVSAFGEEARRFGLREPRGVLVCGVQGCGKSLVVKAAAAVLGLPLVRLDFAALFGSPSPERAFREVVRVLEALAPIVLWVDEIEKGLGDGAASPVVARVFGGFLTWLQERRAPVFVGATANEVDRLPPELVRRGRFDEVFFVDLPGPGEREEILRIHLARRGRDAARFSVAELARPLEHFSGAEIEQVVLAALFRAFGQKRELTREDLEASARELVPLASLYEEKVQAIRDWAAARARRASADRRKIDLFD
jgi:AAA+ superfamily predicted ATPase